MSTQSTHTAKPAAQRITFFTAAWCRPCQDVKLRLQTFLGAALYEDSVDFVDVDDMSSAPQMTTYGVERIPLLVFHQDAATSVVRNATDERALQQAVTIWLAQGAASLPMSHAATVSVAKH